MTILALDISGNFHEGKGTTGCCLLFPDNRIVTYTINANAYASANEYYDKIVRTIISENGSAKGFTVVVEDYLLYGSKAAAQIHSRMETSQLLGIIKYICYKNEIKCVVQRAVDVKNRWTDTILEHNGVEMPTGKGSQHVKDAIRHAMHYKTFGGGKK